MASHTDVTFKTTSEYLESNFYFNKEVGFGNWGSVWRVYPVRNARDGRTYELSNEQPIAVKLVHLTGSAASRLRFKSLYNEMKIVRSLSHDPHPSIVPFYSFLYTDKHAMITMEYLPHPIPVEVPEPRAKSWFRQLLSAVSYLHDRGIVHNDIKPANILLSTAGVPVFVDFGFAETYDRSSPTAFHSNLAYGTPEYLSPERARGLPHDTRKSDVWSLGISIFEILIGRTPFEFPGVDPADSPSKADIEHYWARTLRGKWVGTYALPPTLESLLQRMLSPNADLRCTAKEAMDDRYWRPPVPPKSPNASSRHRKSMSITSSLVFEDMSKILEATPPWTKWGIKRKDLHQESLEDSIVVEVLPADAELGLPKHRGSESPKDAGTPSPAESPKPRIRFKEDKGAPLRRVHSATSKSQLQPQKRAPQPQVPTLLPVTPLSPISSTLQKENIPAVTTTTHPASSIPVLITSANGTTATTTTRKPFASRTNNGVPSNLPVPVKPPTALAKDKEGNPDKEKPRKRPLKDLTSTINISLNRNSIYGTVRSNKSDKEKEEVAASPRDRSLVIDRMKDWEREKERLREMDALEERERIRDAEIAEMKAEEERQQQLTLEQEAKRLAEEEEEKRQHEWDERWRAMIEKEKRAKMERVEESYATTPPPENSLATDANTSISTSLPTESVLKGFKSGFKMSLDRTVQLYKTSTSAVTQVVRRVSTTPRTVIATAKVSKTPGDETFIRDAHIALRVLEDEAEDRKPAADPEDDTRMAIWMQNVERVVDEAVQSFAFASSNNRALPPLPLAPPSRQTSLKYGGSSQQPSAGNSRSNSSSINGHSRDPNRRSSRLPRKLLAASQIFNEEGGDASFNSSVSAYATANNSRAEVASPAGDRSDFLTVSQLGPRRASAPDTPSRTRRATVSTGSPKGDMSPSKRREKSRSSGNLLDQRIRPVHVLEDAIRQREAPVRSPRLSAVMDRSLFVTTPPPRGSRDRSLGVPQITIGRSGSSMEVDELGSSPFQHVDPYPPRVTQSLDIPDSPQQRRLEGVYDRFLLATAGVKRNGKGYQSDNTRPVINISQGNPHTHENHNSTHKYNHKIFSVSRRVMPPPVSSEDFRNEVSVDELGVSTRISTPATPADKGTAGNSLLRAFKAMTVREKRTSRMY